MPAAMPNTEDVRERMSEIVYCNRLVGRDEKKGRRRARTLVLWTTFSGTTGLIWRSFSSAFIVG